MSQNKLCSSDKNCYETDVSDITQLISRAELIISPLSSEIWIYFSAHFVCIYVYMCVYVLVRVCILCMCNFWYYKQTCFIWTYNNSKIIIIIKTLKIPSNKLFSLLQMNILHLIIIESPLYLIIYCRTFSDYNLFKPVSEIAENRNP